MARKGLSLLIVGAIIAATLFLLKECDSNGGGLSPLAKKTSETDVKAKS